ncbi:F-box only protein 15 [Acipenser ruthenus]|uniref:F-box only protein 15 n=1 Tax=Acipenser ruthenus TaxID=7906 RepID=A0A662YW81_ACIRT|nr:F-box only protein 15 [Acipenser ruthenus]
MAAGRGKLFRNYRIGLEKTQSCRTQSVGTGSRALNKEDMPLQSSTKGPEATKSLPTELLFKILSYLDASSLLCVACVNNQFHELANSNALWYNVYITETVVGKIWKPKTADDTAEVMSATSIQEKPDGYWRREYFRKIVWKGKKRWKDQLKTINPFTGLPSNTEKVIRGLQVAWEITVTDRKGIDTTIEQSSACFSDTTATVYWNSTNWPYFNKIKMLQLHGVLRAPVDCPTPNRPGWRSLLAKYDLSGSEPPTILGSDKLVKLLRLHPGLLVGIWRVAGTPVLSQSPQRCCLQFGLTEVNVNLKMILSVNILKKQDMMVCSAKMLKLINSEINFNNDDYRDSPYAVPTDKPLIDDIDPEYGLHGYKLHISLHSAGNIFMSGQFAQLFCKKEYIRNESVRLMVISRNDISQHIAISGKIGTAWNADVLGGVVESCCMMSLTVLDEVQNPFWCVSTPVSMQLSTETSTSYDYMGENYNIKYNDSEGRVFMELVWLKEHEQFFLTSLVLYITTEKVNKHFRTKY